jgi:hypothetical protein
MAKWEIRQARSSVLKHDKSSNRFGLMPQGTLFTEDFLNEGIRGTDAWQALPADFAASFRAKLVPIFAKVANTPDNRSLAPGMCQQPCILAFPVQTIPSQER